MDSHPQTPHLLLVDTLDILLHAKLAVGNFFAKEIVQIFKEEEKRQQLHVGHNNIHHC